VNRERWKRFSNSETHQIRNRESDESAEKTKRRRFNQKLQQDGAATRPKRFARPDFLGSLFHANKCDVHDPNRTNKKRETGDEKSCYGD